MTGITVIAVTFIVCNFAFAGWIAWLKRPKR